MFLWAGCPLAFGAVDFDGVDDYIDAGTTFDISSLPFTISVWINPTNYDSYRGIISKRDTYSSGDMRFSLVLSTTTGEVRCQSGTSDLIAVYALSTSTWTHIAIVPSASTTNLYVNGVFQEDMGAFTLGTDGTAATSIGSNEQNGEDPFLGQIDDLRIYNRALSASEIEVIAKGRLKYDSLTTPGNGLVGYWPLDDSPDGTSGDGDTFVDRSGNGNNGTGVDNANNTGLTVRASGYLMYPAPVR